MFLAGEDHSPFMTLPDIYGKDTSLLSSLPRSDLSVSATHHARLWAVLPVRVPNLGREKGMPKW